MELGDTSDEEASPQHPKKREMSKSQRIQMVMMLQTLQTDDGMRSGSFTMVAKCFGVARSMVHCLWNRVVRMHAHGHISSSSIYRGELSFLQPVHFCICWHDSAVLTSFLFQQWLACACVPNWKMSWESVLS